MFIKKNITILALFIPLFTAAQSQFDDYSLESLTTTAEYGEGERQSNAQNSLAIRYNTGTKGAPLNPTKAVYWFKRSAQNGNKYAMNNLAYAYLNGKGIDKDVTMAAYWMEESAKKYYPSAALTIGKWYYYGTYVAQDYRKAARYLKDAAFGGIAEAMFYYGWCFAYGQGESANYDKANFWAHRAIDNEYYAAYELLGDMYQYGKTVNVDAYQAKRYYELGAEKNILSCMVELGNIYLTDLLGEKDPQKATEYYVSAANQGSTAAMEKLGDLYFYTEYGLDDLSTAAYWYQKSFDIDIASSSTDRLVRIYRYLEKYDAAARVYQKMVDAGDTNAMNELAYLYADGKGVQKDYNMALTLIDKAISSDPGDANYLDSKGEILLKKGDVKGATKIWKKINSSFPLYYQQYSKEHDGEKTNLDEYMSKNAK